ncbi:MAG: type IV pilus twitching motility protein PilT, partial [bacterium]
MRRIDLDKLLTYAVQKEASDIHLSAGSPPILRIHGTLRRIEGTIITSEGLRAVFHEILTEKQRKTLEQALELDFAYAIPKIARFRTNLFFQLRGEAAAFRIIPDRVWSLEELRAPKGIYQLCRQKKGIVLVTGPTGSGKSTTLAAMIDLINQERREHILTIED